MNDQTVAPAATETAVPAAPAVAEPNPTDSGAPQEQPTEKPEKTAEQRELEYLRRKATKADRNNARMYQELQELRQRAPAPAPSGQKVEIDSHELENTVQSRAKEIARIERLNERCNKIAENGNKEFPDFRQALDVMSAEMPLFTDKGPTPALEAIMEMDNPSALIHYLGKNPELASELADLSPYQLTRRLDRIERDMKPQRQVSQAPKPLDPVRPTASKGEPDVDRDPEAWRAWRNKVRRN